jgi:peptidyl-prolyl cis-trans isomerase C
MQRRILKYGPGLLLAILANHALSSFGQSSNPTLATYGALQVTQADYEASILRIPERDRTGFAMSQERIGKEIDNLLRIRVLADAARKQGLEADPTIKSRLALYADRLLAESAMAQFDKESEKEFEAKRASFIESARERYLINKSSFQTKAEVRASHLLITTKSRNQEEALTLTRELRKKLDAGAPFEALAVEYSEDPTAKSNKGDLGYFSAGQMDPAFETAAFSLKSPGEISGPVQSRFGYHLIKLQERKDPRQMTFDEVQPQLLDKLKADFIESRRSQYVQKTYDGARVQWNEPAVLALKKTVDPALIKQLMDATK